MKNLLYVLLDAQHDSVRAFGGIIGIGIALFFVFRKSARKDKEEEKKQEDEKNKMQ